MISNTLALITGAIYCFFIGVICFVALKRSSFGYLIIFYEYFFILGLGVFPLVTSLGLIDLSPIFIDYELTNGDFSYATYIHVVLYAVGSFFGYFCTQPIAIMVGDKLIEAARFCRFPNYKWFYFSSGLSIFLSLLYLYLVGVDIALLNAGPARGGDFSGLVGLEQYSFIKTIAMIGLFSVISLPFIILANKRLVSSAFIVLVLAISLYMLSVARVIFIETIFLFALLYYSLGRRNGKSTMILFLSFIFLLSVAIYGKEFIGMFSAYLFSDDDFVLAVKFDDLFSYLFSQFGHLIYSVDAGVKSFSEGGPRLPKDILVSAIGFFPSSLYSFFGLESLSYQLADEGQRLSCINTMYFPAADKCSVPPYITGYSAYMFPVIGGFIFGFLRFFIYSILEYSWIKLLRNPELLWIVVAALLVVNRLMLFIPNTISFAIFSILTLFIFVIFHKFRLRLI